MATTQLAHLVGIRCDFRLGHLLFDIAVFLKCGNCRGELLVCQCTPFLYFMIFSDLFTVFQRRRNLLNLFII